MKISKAPGKTVLFFHGGPGLNSFCEQSELGPLLLSNGFTGIFWNEPSVNRPQGDSYNRVGEAFAGWINSAEKLLLHQAQDNGPVHLIGHSFAVTPLLELARKHQEHCKSLVFLAPGFDLHDLQKNILRIAYGDFLETEPAKATRLCELLEQTRSVFDPFIEEGFHLALSDPRLLSHYWSAALPMQQYLEYLTKPESAFDLNALFDVLKGLRNFTPSQIHSPLNIPSLVIFGEKDPVVSRDLQISLAHQSLRNPQIVTLPALRHYPHLENKEAFLNFVVPFLTKASTF